MTNDPKPMTYVVAAMYHFFDFPDFEERRDAILAEFIKHNIKGSLLIASEGFNGTISGTREDIDAILDYLKREVAKSDFEHKESFYTRQPFGRAKVRLKRETISVGEPVSREHVGIYIEPKDWNDLISQPDVLLLDTRNRYETHLGTFEGAIDPDTRVFKELPAFVRKNFDPKKHKRVATFCTGGIRCEKFTAWMKQEGFEDVYHLKGGILKYLEEIPPEQSKWQGECFVFDERVAVGHGLYPTTKAVMCPNCGLPVTEEDKKHPLYIEGRQCQFCDDVEEG